MCVPFFCPLLEGDSHATSAASVLAPKEGMMSIGWNYDKYGTHPR